MIKELYPLFGIVTVLNTPFTRDDRIDFSGLKRNVENAIQAGVGGFLVPAMASEVYKLSRKERSDIVSTVVEQVDNRVPVIGGAGELDADKRVQIVQDLIQTGCKNILLQIPFQNENQYKSDLYRIADMDVDMIMLQDWDFGGYGLPVPLICDLFDTVDAFRCLKIEVVPAGIKYSEILAATQDRLNVSGGWAVQQMIEGLDRGVHAFMPTGMHEIYCEIYRLYKENKIEQAKSLFYKLLPVLAFANQHLDISIHFFKRLLYKQGIYETSNVREPILTFDTIHEKTADLLINRVIELITSLDIKGK